MTHRTAAYVSTDQERSTAMTNDERYADGLEAEIEDLIREGELTPVDFAELARHGYALIPKGYFDRDLQEFNWLVSDLMIWGLDKRQADAVARWFQEYRSQQWSQVGYDGDEEWMISIDGMPTAAAESFMSRFADWPEKLPPPPLTKTQ
jgi:hypothetical protein